MINLQNTQRHSEVNAQEKINQKLRLAMEGRVFYYAQHPEAIDKRLGQLEREWNIERVLEVNAAGLSLLGLLMAVRKRRWIILSLAGAGFLLQHAIKGWCPPEAIFRRFGIRTTAEINAEKEALKAIKGDFNRVIEEGTDKKAKAALEAVF